MSHGCRADFSEILAEEETMGGAFFFEILKSRLAIEFYMSHGCRADFSEILAEEETTGDRAAAGRGLLSVGGRRSGV